MAQKRSTTRSKKSIPAQPAHSVGWGQGFVFLLLLGVAAGLWLGKDHVSALIAGGEQAGKSQNSKTKGVPVVAARVGEQANDVIVGAIGTGRARRSVMLFPEAAGEIEHFFVESGQRVAKGEMLMRLDSREAELAVRVARTRLIEADRLMKRSQQLREKNINSQANVDDARNVVDRAEFELQQAEEALEKRELVAPFDGVVGIPKVELGDRISAATQVLSIDDRSRLIVEFEVPEQFLAEIKPGLKVAAQTPSYRERVFEGVIEHIDSRIDPTSRTVVVRAVIPNREDLLRPGMSFVVDMTIPGKTYPTVHELALQWRKGVSYVWAIRDGKSEKVPVKNVRRLNSTILIEGDLAKGDLVVVEGVHRLRPGRPVSFTEPEAAPSS